MCVRGHCVSGVEAVAAPAATIVRCGWSQSWSRGCGPRPPWPRSAAPTSLCCGWATTDALDCCCYYSSQPPPPPPPQRTTSSTQPYSAVAHRPLSCLAHWSLIGPAATAAASTTTIACPWKTWILLSLPPTTSK